jgi:hypothetical protein
MPLENPHFLNPCPVKAQFVCVIMYKLLFCSTVSFDTGFVGIIWFHGKIGETFWGDILTLLVYVTVITHCFSQMRPTMNALIAQQMDLSSPFLKRKHHVAPYIFLAKFLVPDWEGKVNFWHKVVVPARQPM